MHNDQILSLGVLGCVRLYGLCLWICQTVLDTSGRVKWNKSQPCLVVVAIVWVACEEPRGGNNHKCFATSLKSGEQNGFPEAWRASYFWSHWKRNVRNWIKSIASYS